MGHVYLFDRINNCQELIDTLTIECDSASEFFKHLAKITMPSSNGRTSDFGSDNHGSNPCGITNIKDARRTEKQIERYLKRKCKYGEEEWDQMYKIDNMFTLRRRAIEECDATEADIY